MCSLNHSPKQERSKKKNSIVDTEERRNASSLQFRLGENYSFWRHHICSQTFKALCVSDLWDKKASGQCWGFVHECTLSCRQTSSEHSVVKCPKGKQSIVVAASFPRVPFHPCLFHHRTVTLRSEVQEFLLNLPFKNFAFGGRGVTWVKEDTSLCRRRYLLYNLDKSMPAKMPSLKRKTPSIIRCSLSKQSWADLIYLWAETALAPVEQRAQRRRCCRLYSTSMSKDTQTQWGEVVYTHTHTVSLNACGLLHDSGINSWCQGLLATLSLSPSFCNILQKIPLSLSLLSLVDRELQ